MKQLPSIPLSYNPIEIDALSAKLREYEYRHHDDLIEDFESELKKILGIQYVVALNSGTAALHLGLKALNVGKDDIVISSTFTYVASVNPVLYLGATPFFVDSCRDDWNMDPELLENAIRQCLNKGKKPKVILVVHTYGMPAKLDRILEVAKRYSIPVLEDAAESVGSTFQGRFTGTIGDIGIFSFNNNKSITTYGGGVLITSDPLMASKVNSWANQSRDNLPFYEHRDVGFNYRMSPLNAAFGLAQLNKISQKVVERVGCFNRYRNGLFDELSTNAFQVEGANVSSNRWLTGIVLPGNASDIRANLLEKGIETRFFWKPMHLQPLFSGALACLSGVSDLLFQRGLCLPSSFKNPTDQDTVIEAVKDMIVDID